MLENGESVTQVCLASGFESVSSFSSLFRRHYGIPPRAFRARRERRKPQEGLEKPAAA